MAQQWCVVVTRSAEASSRLRAWRQAGLSEPINCVAMKSAHLVLPYCTPVWCQRLRALLAELVNVRLRMQAWDAALGMIGLQRQIAWVVACSGLVACLAAVAALIAFAIAGIDFLDGARLFYFACAGGSMVGALMARGSLWAMQRERSVFSRHGADARTRAATG